MPDDPQLLAGAGTLPSRAAKFYFLYWVYLRVTPRWFRRIVDGLSSCIAPDVPVSLGAFLGETSISRVFWNGVAITWVMAFGGSVIGAALNGTLYGTDQSVRYFVNDWPNIVNYLLLCPMYVALSLVLVVLSIRMRSSANARTHSARGNMVSSSDGRMPPAVLVVAILSIGSVVTANYAAEVLHPNIYSVRFWFVSLDPTEQVRVLGPFGVYYALLNFVLLVICLLAAFCFFDFVRIGRNIGNSIRALPDNDPIRFVDLKKFLTNFTLAYMVSKSIIVVLMLNSITWKLERPEGSLNLLLMMATLAIVGVILVPFPRYYVQMQWYEFNIRRAAIAGEQPPSYQDLRPTPMQGAATFFDAVLFLGFAGSSITWLIELLK